MRSQVVNRLKRVRGQIDGLIRLIESDAECKKIVEQFNAADGALKSAVDIYLSQHLNSCLEKADKKTRNEIRNITSAFIIKR
ncbi:MAG: metal-sensitive transcriptional regulator [Candidatus Paceibacterota bacterium]